MIPLPGTPVLNEEDFSPEFSEGRSSSRAAAGMRVSGHDFSRAEPTA